MGFTLGLSALKSPNPEAVVYWMWMWVGVSNLHLLPRRALSHSLSPSLSLCCFTYLSICLYIHLTIYLESKYVDVERHVCSFMYVCMHVCTHVHRIRLCALRT